MSGETLRREFGRPGSARFCAGRVTGRSGRAQAGPAGRRHAISVQGTVGLFDRPLGLTQPRCFRFRYTERRGCVAPVSSVKGLARSFSHEFGANT